MFKAIEATDWAALPGPAVIYTPENGPSVRCFTAAGFTAEADTPDDEGIIYFRRPRRPA